MTRIFRRITPQDMGVRWRNYIEQHRRILGVIVLGFVVALPFVAMLFPASVAVTITQVSVMTMVYMVLALGLNIVPGFTGLLDLGYVGFYGVGAYTAGLLSVHYGMPFWLILPWQR